MRHIFVNGFGEDSTDRKSSGEAVYHIIPDGDKKVSDILSTMEHIRKKGDKSALHSTGGLIREVIGHSFEPDSPHIIIGSHRRDVNDDMFESESAFTEACEAIRTLVSKESIPSVVVPIYHDYTGLPSLVRFIFSFSPKIPIVLVTKDPFTTEKKRVPVFTRLRPFLEEAIRFCETNGQKLYISPAICTPCLIGIQGGSYISWEHSLLIPAEGNPYIPAHGWSHPDACTTCTLKDSCRGLHTSMEGISATNLSPLTNIQEKKNRAAETGEKEHTKKKNKPAENERKKTENVEPLREKILIWNLCNNDCFFCSTDSEMMGRDQETRTMSYESILSRIDEIHDNNATEILLYGGEPTLREDFLDIMDHISSKGFPEVKVQTNGRLLSNPEFARRYATYGAETIISLHGHTAALHNLHTNTESYDETLNAIRNLKNEGCRVNSNTVITARNHRFLRDITALLLNLGVDVIQMAIMHPYGRAKKDFRNLAPHMNTVVPNLLHSIKACERAGVEFLAEGFPLCLLGPYRHHATEKKLIKNINSYAESYEIRDYRRFLREHKAKTQACEACRLYEVCEGYFKEYGEHDLVYPRPL